MALDVFVGRTALPTDGTGTTDLTSADSAATPVAAIHACSRGTVDETLANDFVISIGMSDGTTSRSMSSTANDNQTADDATKGYHDNVISATTPGNESQDGGVTHNSFISSGQRVNDAAAFSAAHLCNHIFFAGCNAIVQEVTLDATVDTTVNTDPGFVWDVALVIHCRETVLGDEDVDNMASFGFMVKADDSQACICTGTNNGDASPGGPSAQISKIYSGMRINEGTGALIYGIDVQAGTGTTADIFPRIAGGESVLVSILFLGFTTGESVKIVESASPAATGNDSVTGAGGVPIAVIDLISRVAAYDTADATAEAGAIGVGFSTDDSQFCISAMNEFATGGNSNTVSENTAASIKLRRDDGAETANNAYKAAHVTMDADGWTRDWTIIENSGAGKIISLAFLPASGLVPIAAYHYRNHGKWF